MPIAKAESDKTQITGKNAPTMEKLLAHKTNHSAQERELLDNLEDLAESESLQSVESKQEDGRDLNSRNKGMK